MHTFWNKSQYKFDSFPGETWQQKIWEFDGTNDLDSVRSQMIEANAGALVVAKLDEIACKFISPVCKRSELECERRIVK